MLCGGIHCLITVMATCAPPLHPALAEVFYDAIGDDSGHEFVEILNRGTTSVSLAGARLEVGDGSGPGRWTLRWTGAPGDSIGPGRRFVIGGMAVVPRPQSIAALDLQTDRTRCGWCGPTAPTRCSGTARTTSPSTSAAPPRPMSHRASHWRACRTTPTSAATRSTSAPRRPRRDRPIGPSATRRGSRARWRSIPDSRNPVARRASPARGRTAAPSRSRPCAWS
jgi:hypothetical protein